MTEHDLEPQRTWMPKVSAFSAALLTSIILYLVYSVEEQRYQQEVRTDTLEYLGGLRAQIEEALGSELRLFTGLVVLLSLHPETSKEEIESTVKGLINKAKLVRSVGVSKGYVVDYVYPREGNEAAIGLNYLDNPVQREPVLRAAQNREDVLAGPIRIIQGGEALIGRLPIFSAAASEQQPAETFLGIVSILLDLDRLYETLGLRGSTNPFNIAIRGKDGLGSRGEVFFGDPELFKTDFTSVSLNLPGGHWEMIATPPAQTLYQHSDRSTLILSMGIALILLCTIAAFIVTRHIEQQRTLIAVQQRSREQIWHSATHDRLTNLPNRHFFMEELNHHLAKAKRANSRLAIYFLDLDRFKDINDSFGHNVGDQFLKVFSDKLRNQIRQTEMVARLGGDEFAVVSTEVDDIDDIANLASRITEFMNLPFTVDNHKLHAGVSVGIAVYPNDGDTPGMLLQHADLAMYSAKQNPSSSYAFFEESMNRRLQNRQALIEDIRTSLQHNYFSLVYQPVVDILQNRIIGVETLCRLNHPTRGIVPPTQFIPASEASGLIVPLGQWVINHAAQDAVTWLADNPGDFSMSVNLSPVQFHNSDPVMLVRNVLDDTGLPPQSLDIEITESTLMEDVDKAVRIVKELKMLGVSISIDDFGTGYSSLSRLRHLPVNRIKIDISFVRQIGKDRHSEAIIKAIIYLSETLNIRTTAEGVETLEQLEFLRDLGCREIQGYYFYKPQTAEDLVRCLHNEKLAEHPLQQVSQPS